MTSQHMLLPAGYHYEYLRREQIPMLISALETWYPAIGVGNSSCHRREGFYASEVCLEEPLERDFLVVLVHAQQRVGRDVLCRAGLG